jgi:flagellar biosynthesis/type III secretory pathway protein FliH
MALAVLKNADRVQVVATSTVLRAGEWQALQQSGLLREELKQDAARQTEIAIADATARLTEKAQALERQTQYALLLKALGLQLEFEGIQERWQACFVDTMMTSLSALLGTELPPGYFAQVQGAASRFVGENTPATLHVAPADEAAVREALGHPGQALTWCVDLSLGQGQCFLETRFGRVQASLATQLEGLRDALQRWFQEPRSATQPEVDVQSKQGGTPDVLKFGGDEA